MTSFERWVVTLSVISVIGIPLLLFLIRGAMKWTHVEDKLTTLVDKMTDLVGDKDKVHKEMLSQMAEERSDNNKTHREILEQMRIDRDATDKRLRYIEEYWMDQGRKAALK